MHLPFYSIQTHEVMGSAWKESKENGRSGIAFQLLSIFNWKGQAVRAQAGPAVPEQKAICSGTMNRVSCSTISPRPSTAPTPTKYAPSFFGF